MKRIKLLCLLLALALVLPIMGMARARQPEVYYINGDWSYQTVPIPPSAIGHHYLEGLLDVLVTERYAPDSCVGNFPTGMRVNKAELRGDSLYVDFTPFILEGVCKK